MDDPRREPLCNVTPITEGGVATGMWSVLLALPTDRAYPFTISFPARLGMMDGEMYKAGAMRHWGLIKIGPGTWKVDPSIHQPNVLHAYLVLCEVPEPAPWE